MAIKGEEAMELFKVVKSNNLLPARIDGLVPLSFIGKAAVGYYRELISHMDELGMTEEQRKATLRDGQDAGELLLDIEARIGEIAEREVRSATKPIKNGSPFVGSEPSGTAPKHERLGMPKKKMKQAQQIHKNPEVVERVKAMARENEDIPTKTAVLAEIRYQNEKKRREEAEGTKRRSRTIIAVEQLQYISALDKCIYYLPQKPPKDWDNSVLKEATAKAKIIIKRLEVFNV